MSSRTLRRVAARVGEDRWPVVTNTAARAGALFTLVVATLLVARVGGAREVGIYTMLRIIPGLAGVLLSAGLPGAVAYFVAGPTTGDRRLRPTIVAIMVAGSLLGLGLWVAGSFLLQPAFFRELSLGFVVVAALAVPSQLVVAVSKSCCQGGNDMGGANLVIFLEEAMFLPAYALLVAFGVHGHATILAGLVLADLATAVPAWWRLARRGFFASHHFGRPSIALGRQVAGYGLRGQLGGLMSLINLRLDHAILGAFAGNSVLGVYAIASKFAELLRLVPTALSYVLYPRFARSTPETATREARSMLRSAGLLTAAAAAILGLAAGVLPLIYGRSFSGAVGPARILLIGLAGEGIAGVITAYLYGRGRPGLNSLAMGAGVVVTVALDVALIKPFGAVGAAWASAVAYLVTDLALVAWFVSTSRSRSTRLVPALAVSAGR